MQYEFNFSPDIPSTPYNTEGGLDSSTYSKDGKLISTQRTGFIEVDSGKVDLVKDGEVVDLPQEVVERLEKPQPISTTLYYTQSSVYSAVFCDEEGNCAYYPVNKPADARNMTDGVYDDQYATGTRSSSFEWVQVDLNGIFDIKGVVVGCDWVQSNSSFYYDEELGRVVSEDPEAPGLLGSWGKIYTENCDVQCSLDGKEWTFLFNTGTFEKPVQIYPVNARARYLRIVAQGGDLAVKEFYAI